MLVAVDAMDFHFESTCPTPYMSAPSSPRRFGHGGGDYYFSAPTSPARASAIYQEFNSTQRFNWDESIENPKSRDTHHDEEEDDDEDVDFAFDFGVQLDRTSLTADELFDGGKIKPLLQQPQTINRFSQIDYDEFNNKSRNRKSPISSPRSPTQGKKQIHPFNRGEEQDRGRGRTMTPSSSKSNRSSRESRSHSPLRIAEFAWEEEQQLQQQQQQQQQTSSKPTSSTSTSTPAADTVVASLKGSKKWSFRDLLLFRSASEGRASDKDPLRKYTAAAMVTKRSSTNEIDEKNNGSSFRSTDNNPGSRKKGPVSAHELHYKVNRAVAEESRRKTYLPYKPRLFGFLGFNSTTVHSQRF